MSNFGKFIIIVVGMHLLWGGALYFRRGPVERDLTEHVNASLNLPEYSDVSVEFNGRKGTLMGTVKSPESIARAEKLARGYWGVRAIDNRLVVAAESSAGDLSKTLPAAEVPTSAEVIQPEKLADVSGYQSNGKFQLSGNVPDWYIRNELISQAEEVFGTGNVAIALRVDFDLKIPADFMDSYRRFMDIQRFKFAGFELDNGDFTLKTDLPHELAEVRPAENMSASRMPVRQITYPTNATAANATDADRKLRKLELNNILSSLVIEFDTSSAALTERSRQQADMAGKILNRYPEEKIEIQGYTDNAGSPEANRQLSSARADSVYGYLIKLGVAAERLVATGYGETRPLADNSTADGRQRNRRVVLLAP